MTDSEVRVIEADLYDPSHERDVVALTAAYAADAMGDARVLPAEVLERLVPALREHPTTMIFLAYRGQEAIGIATCFLGFTTFAARPLVNIHDLAVLRAHRGRGVARALLQAVEQAARARGCVELTLEVGDQNTRARGIYEAFGFSHSLVGPAAGRALFFAKRL